MPEFGGLQIEARCVKCSRLSTAEIALFELQNHLYICNICSNEEMRSGRQISLAGGNRLSPQRTPSSTSPPAVAPRSAPPGNLPADSLFVVLELPLTASLSQIRETIRQQMGFWLKQRGNPQQKQMVAKLREWQNDLVDEEMFEENRAKLKELAKSDIIGLSVGGRTVFSLDEFLDACEELKDGWIDGERLLRIGELAHWILFQLDDQQLAEQALYYQNQRAFSDFRALNTALYALLPERPFRFYQSEHWQARSVVSSATNPKELADLCDLDWETGLFHLYRGSLVFWLEYSQEIPDLQAYYTQAVAGYERQPGNRGLGLELLLERAIPDTSLLPRPKLVVTLDGHVGSCTISGWDQEIPHQPISVVVTNTTRGFTSLSLSPSERLASSDPYWIRMNEVTISGLPGAGLPYTTQVYFDDLSQLKRGRTYIHKLDLFIDGAYGSSPTRQQFPIVLKTLRFYQGLRGKLWLFGLRGNLPGAIWSALLGLIFSFLFLQLFSGLLFPWYFSSAAASSPQWDMVNMTLVNFNADIIFLGPYFIWSIAALVGWTGLVVGLGKGHDEHDVRRGYNARRGSKAFRRWHVWLLGPGAVLALLFWDRDFLYITSNQVRPNDIAAVLLGYLVLWFLVALIASLIAWLRSRLEKFVRRHYAGLLLLAGRV